jgi:hypothetical protein
LRRSDDGGRRVCVGSHVGDFEAHLLAVASFAVDELLGRRVAFDHGFDAMGSRVYVDFGLQGGAADWRAVDADFGVVTIDDDFEFGDFALGKRQEFFGSLRSLRFSGREGADAEGEVFGGIAVFAQVEFDQAELERNVVRATLCPKLAVDGERIFPALGFDGFAALDEVALTITLVSQARACGAEAGGQDQEQTETSAHLPFAFQKKGVLVSTPALEAADGAGGRAMGLGATDLAGTAGAGAARMEEVDANGGDSAFLARCGADGFAGANALAGACGFAGAGGTGSRTGGGGGATEGGGLVQRMASATAMKAAKRMVSAIAI